MKKLSLLIASLLCVTIGGVYATWYYATSNNVGDKHQHIGLELTADKLQGGYGSYTVDVKVGMWIVPESADSYEAALYFGAADIDGNVTPAQPDDAAIVITYTPDDYVPDDVDNFGLTTYWSLSWKKGDLTSLEDWKYGTKQIFSEIKTTVTTIYPYETEEQTNVWSAKADGKFTYTITVGTLKNMINLSTGITLDTVTKYNEFQTALSGGTIGINVNDGVADTTTNP
ncbi:MAG: hypothetical protein IJF64_00350 [Clostridia bacterium]|nr:hypothetical protein [Clostridia bacterium]